VVVAAGNDRTDASQSAPAGCANVIAVGAVRPDGRRSNYSNFTAASSRSVVDVMAPGGEMSLTYASASAEPATLPTGVLEFDMWGNPIRWGYLHAEAEYCAQREAYVSPTTWSGWTPVRELYQGAMRWICVNAAANWRSPVFVRRDSAILSTVKSGASVYGDTFGVFESQAGRFDSMVGTSMAAPHVAGVVALMLARNPALTPALVEARLKASARPMTEAQCKAGQTTYAVNYARGSGTVATSAAFPPGSAPCGAGMVDAAAAVNEAALPL
jgi:subtilisin family serine protease